jgi:hypothetical protein
VNTVEVLAHLTAHWPQLGGDGPEAEVRLRDWAQVISQNSAQTREAACEALVTGWQSEWPPKIADWREACRQLASRADLERPAIEAPQEPTVARERVAALIEQARKSIDANRYRRSA